jgi:NADH dehydrogenase FAD-containing subunit
MLAASTMAALAAEAKGAITSIDTDTGTVTLASGETFKLPADFDTASLAVGDNVTITYDDGAMGSGGEMQATDVMPSS